ncbi:hypothetical protein CCHR01_06671 [Colletotrichum chrysophilum]|uniref:Uncharacterized protein n=1 Tax=Colletotrichum chrysophilum TaxID=1836956 RepID=A0AAD9AM23_9PEZI|nr:hypothetical protein CCHR01_06671 [Colletotrichum chrysophilum]
MTLPSMSTMREVIVGLETLWGPPALRPSKPQYPPLQAHTSHHAGPRAEAALGQVQHRQPSPSLPSSPIHLISQLRTSAIAMTCSSAS